MHFHPEDPAEVPVPHIVKLDAVGLCFPFENLDNPPVHVRIRHIHQPADTLPNQSDSGNENVECDNNGGDRIPGQPVRQQSQTEAHQHP